MCQAFVKVDIPPLQYGLFKIQIKNTSTAVEPQTFEFIDAKEKTGTKNRSQSQTNKHQIVNVTEIANCTNETISIANKYQSLTLFGCANGTLLFKHDRGLYKKIDKE